MRDSDQSGLRTLLVGLEGVCERVLRPQVEAGRAPTLGGLVADGTAAPLPSQVAPEPASAWPSLYTGANPGRHGVFDRVVFEEYDWRPASFEDVREHALWELLDRRGHASVVVNAPLTGPPAPFDGALVPGWGGPDRPTCHPEGLLADLDDVVGDYRVYGDRDANGDSWVRQARRLAGARAAAFTHLADRFDPAFGFLAFHQTGTVLAERPEDETAVAAVFEAVDDAVAGVLDATDPDVVVLASEHGVAPVAGPSFRVNDYLRDVDLLAADAGPGGLPPPDVDEQLDEPLPRSGVTERLASAAATAGATSQRVAAALERVGIGGALRGLVPDSVARAARERVDPESSVAYARTGTEYGVRINRAGREPDGVVSPAEYPSVRSDVVDGLRAVRTPDGTRAFSAVGPAEQFFGGPYVPEGPDVVTVPHRYDVHLDASLRGRRFGDPPTAYVRVPRGVLALAGDAVDTRVAVEEPHLFDVAPTVLASLGVPPSSRMDGRTLEPVSGPEPEEYAPFTGGTRETATASGRLSNPGHGDRDQR